MHTSYGAERCKRRDTKNQGTLFLEAQLTREVDVTWPGIWKKSKESMLSCMTSLEWEQQIVCTWLSWPCTKRYIASQSTQNTSQGSKAGTAGRSRAGQLGRAGYLRSKAHVLLLPEAGSCPLRGGQLALDVVEQQAHQPQEANGLARQPLQCCDRQYESMYARQWDIGSKLC